MIYRFGFFFICVLVVGCSPQELQQEILEENYTYFNKEKNDSIRCLQVGIQSVDENNVITIEALKHELVDETPAKVKLEGRIINTTSNSLTLITSGDTIKGNLSFALPTSANINSLEVITQGVIALKPSVNFEIDGLLIKGISKKSP